MMELKSYRVLVSPFLAYLKPSLRKGGNVFEHDSTGLFESGACLSTPLSCNEVHKTDKPLTLYFWGGPFMFPNSTSAFAPEQAHICLILELSVNLKMHNLVSDSKSEPSKCNLELTKSPPPLPERKNGPSFLGTLPTH